MKTQIVYVVVSSENDLFLEELWASLFSLRIYHPEATVKVLADEPTAKRIHKIPALDKMITEVVEVDVPKEYSAMARSRVIKTTIRNVIDGAFLYIDTDTVICHSLEEIDDFEYDIAAVPDLHQTLKDDFFRQSKIDRIKNSVNVDISSDEYYFNGGVMYVADNELTRKFYNRWHENWESYMIDGVRGADQPPLVQTDKELGYIIKCLPDVFNCQVALSVRYLHEAYIVHFFHMNFIADQSYSPFMGLDIYREIKRSRGISPHAEETIRHCKSAWDITTTIIGKPQIDLVFSPTGQAYCMIAKRNKKLINIFNWISMKFIQYYRFKDKIKKTTHKD